jgi:hypothetical protein
MTENFILDINSLQMINLQFFFEFSVCTSMRMNEETKFLFFKNSNISSPWDVKEIKISKSMNIVLWTCFCFRGPRLGDQTFQMSFFQSLSFCILFLVLVIFVNSYSPVVANRGLSSFSHSCPSFSLQISHSNVLVYDCISQISHWF